MASSFLDELAGLTRVSEFAAAHPWISSVHVMASSAVLQRVQAATRSTLKVEEHDATVDLRLRRLPVYDLAFSVFGPVYVPPRANIHVVGFADLTSLIADFSRPALFDVRTRLKRPVRHLISRSQFRRADHVVVEAPAARDALQEHWGIDPRRVSVVSNTYDSLFDTPERWERVDVPRLPDRPNVCYVAKGYTHKNHAVLGPLGDELERRGRPVQFILVLTPDEWARVPASARRHSVNIGPVPLAQLPDLYRGCDVSIFPSLLECFSATPVESLVMGTPLVASDRPFVRSICGEAAWYADPQDPLSLADAMLWALDDPAATSRVALGREVAAQLPTAGDRAAKYVELLSSLLPPRTTPGAD